MKFFLNLILLIRLYFGQAYPITLKAIYYIFKLFYVILMIKRIIFFALIQWYFCLNIFFYFTFNKDIMILNIPITLITFILFLVIFFNLILLVFLGKVLHNTIFINLIFTLFVTILFGYID